MVRGIMVNFCCAGMKSMGREPRRMTVISVSNPNTKQRTLFLTLQIILPDGINFGQYRVVVSGNPYSIHGTKYYAHSEPFGIVQK